MKLRGIFIIAKAKLLPESSMAWKGELSRVCLFIAISALGVTTGLAQVLEVNTGYGAIFVIVTLFLLVIALAIIMWIGI